MRSTQKKGSEGDRDSKRVALEGYVEVKMEIQKQNSILVTLR
jgi:hypothetical protein